ncbi:MAG TPA: SRPBCC family protein [Mycobacteriales bacterium]|nr:SRPBCC family protein [Mycobacteriales bacterium]
MPTIRVSAEVHADPATVYGEVSDLPGHARWAADPIEVVPVDDTALGVGKRFRSTATSKGTSFTADLVVTEHTPPRRFAFTAVDATGCYQHTFVVEPTSAGSKVSRTVVGELTPAQRLLFALVYLPVKKPNARLALRRLKAHLEPTPSPDR